MSGLSPIDLPSPISDAQAAAAFGDAGREELLDELTRLPFGRGARRRPAGRRRLVIAVAALALAVVATAATWVLRGHAPARETTSVECVIKGVDTIIPSTSGDPAQDCAVEWKRELGEAAPRLVAYDNGIGGVTVLPSTQTPPAGFKRLGSQAVALIQLQNSLDDYINGLNSSCLDGTAATSFTRSRLAKFGFKGWTVAVHESTSRTKTCVGGALVDPTTKTVTLGSSPVATGPKPVFEKLAVRLRRITQRCQSLPAAVSSVRAAASSLGLSESARGYDLNTVTDNAVRCASVYETVGGTIFLTVRGPSR